MSDKNQAPASLPANPERSGREEAIRDLETRLRYLEDINRFSLDALDMAASLGDFQSAVLSSDDPVRIVRLTASRLRRLIPFTSMAFYLVDETDADFILSYADPEQSAPRFQAELDHLVESRYFAWALARRKPVVASTSDGQDRILLHAIATSSRTRGMFLGLVHSFEEVPDVSLAILSIIMHNSANAMETFEQNVLIRGMNEVLQEKVDRLAASEEELARHRNRLQDLVGERTRELGGAVARMKAEILERTSAEAALRASEERLRAVYEFSPIAIELYNREGRLTSANRACLELFGVDEAENILGQDLFTDPHIPAEVKAHLKQGMAVRFEVDYDFGLILEQSQYRTSKSGLMHLDVRITPLCTSGFEGYLLQAVDITQRRQTEAALRESECRNRDLAEKFRTIFENAIEGIYQIDPLRGFIGANPALARILGYGSPEELLEARTAIRSELFVDPADWDELSALISENGSATGFEAQIRRKDGTIVWASLNCRSVRNEPSGALLYFEGTLEDISEKKRFEMNLERKANFDDLTGLPNRASFLERFQRALDDAARHAHRLAVLYIDLDMFKEVNDSYGHHTGDALLRQAARRLVACVKSTDIVARLGGDEFLVLLTRIRKSEDARTVAEKIRNSLNAPFDLEGRMARIGASVGISIFPRDGVDAGELIRTADLAMYRAKEKGRNTLQFHHGDSREERS